MFIRVLRPVYKNSSPSWENGKWHLALGDAKTNKMIVSKNFNHPIDVKFPCVKLIMTPVWLCHDSIRRVIPIFHLYSDSWEENEFKEIVIIFKMTEDAASFFEGGSEIEIRTLRNWTGYREKIKASIYFWRFSLLVIGKLRVATMNTKTGRKSSENETQPFCNHFWSISSRLPC